MKNYIEYMLLVITKMPRTEKFNIGNEFKSSMYDTLEKILYISKLEKNKRMYYLNIIDTKLNCQRIFLRIMQKQKWIDEKKYKIAFEHLLEIGSLGPHSNIISDYIFQGIYTVEVLDIKETYSLLM